MLYTSNLKSSFVYSFPFFTQRTLSLLFDIVYVYYMMLNINLKIKLSLKILKIIKTTNNCLVIRFYFKQIFIYLQARIITIVCIYFIIKQYK